MVRCSLLRQRLHKLFIHQFQMTLLWRSPHGLRITSKNHCLSTQFARESTNADLNCAMQIENHKQTCPDSSNLSGPRVCMRWTEAKCRIILWSDKSKCDSSFIELSSKEGRKHSAFASAHWCLYWDALVLTAGAAYAIHTKLYLTYFWEATPNHTLHFFCN